jgi:predicted DNA-binding transcriptional regulator YafY
LAKAFALIRSHFQRDPERLSDDEFAQLLNEALWLEKYRGEMLEKRLTKAVADVLAMMASR